MGGPGLFLPFELKVEALRADLEATRIDTCVVTHVYNVIRDTDAVRDLLVEIDVIVCTADGVLPRRVVSHLARRAGIPACLACVLADGAYGDLMRLWPWPAHGCYQCRLDTLTETGGLVPALEPGSGYLAQRHAMTAVGTDLHLLGQLAGKMAAPPTSSVRAITTNGSLASMRSLRSGRNRDGQHHTT